MSQDSQPMAHQEPILTEKHMFKIMYRTTKGYENAANHFMGLDYSYPTKESAIKAYTFLKKDSPRCIFIIVDTTHKRGMNSQSRQVYHKNDVPMSRPPRGMSHTGDAL